MEAASSGRAGAEGRPDLDDLPHPESAEVRRLLGTAEVIAAYAWLYENRAHPKPMSDWVERSQALFQKTNSNTARRLRDVYPVFDVEVFREPATGEFVYQLVGRRPEALDTAPISKRLEAEVYTVKGRWCAMCGLGPTDGVKLQIDHIIPREWGGQTELRNLEPLCAPHNHGKQAFFSTYDAVGPQIERAMRGPDPWSRIGELLKSFYEQGEPCPVELIHMVAKETHKGDPLKRLRELRFILGWPIIASKRKDSDGVTHMAYLLRNMAPPWPPEGPAAEVLRYERERRRRKALNNVAENEETP